VSKSKTSTALENVVTAEASCAFVATEAFSCRLSSRKIALDGKPLMQTNTEIGWKKNMISCTFCWKILFENY
jgi:hypothetical protein